MTTPELEIAAPPAEQSFLGNVFDHYQNMMQITRCIREVGRQRGISRPRVLELSRYATNLLEYLPEVRLTRCATHDEQEEPRLSTPVSLPFADKSFDACFVTDVYEHIPIPRRPELLREICRITEGLVLIGTPVETEIVTRVDRLIFDFIWCKYAVRFNPLKQHIEYGLEPQEAVIAHLKALGAQRVVALPDNFVYRLIHQILLFFELQYDNPLSRELYEPVNRVYNELIGGRYDYREPCYRYLLAVATDPRLDLAEFAERMKLPPETPASLRQAEGVLIEAFKAADARAIEELKARLKETNQLRHELWLRDTELAQLKHEATRRDAETAQLNHAAAAKDEGIAWLKQEVALRDAEITRSGHEAALRNDQLAQFKNNAALKEQEIAQIKNEAALKEQEIAQIKNEAALKEQEIARLNHEVWQTNNEVAQLRARMQQFDYWGGRWAGGLYKLWKSFAK